MYDKSQLKEIIDKALVSYSYNSDADSLLKPVQYALSVGGKRLRPILLLMSCNLFSDNISEAVPPAAGVELFHNFTLLHDDIMDNAHIRRNFPTVHNKWGINQAILSGDVMAFMANECFLQLPPEKMRKVLRLFNDTAIGVCKGQQLDMDYEKKDIVIEEDYIGMIELKTALLISTSLKIGAIVGGASDRDTQILGEFGRNMGLAFQIQDDMLDIWSDEKVFGKTSGGDIVSNKKTLPIIKALETASGEELRTLKALFSSKTVTDSKEKIDTVTSILNNLNIKGTIAGMSESYMDKAFNLLKTVSVEESRKEELLLTTRSVLTRNR